jgi:hypothetical protein
MKVTPVVAALLAATVASAAEYRQSVSVGALEVFGLGINASLAPLADPPTSAKTDHEYLDGYNRVDSSGNLGEGAPGLPSRTSNFGYVSNSQIDLTKGTLSWHTVSPGGSSYVNRSSQRSRPGAEIQYRILRESEGRPVWGLEARAGYLESRYSGSETLTTTVRLLTDSYQLGGVVPQPAPYSGFYEVRPGLQRIGDIPTRTIGTAASTAQGQREFSAEGWLLRLGAVWQPVATRRLDWQLHAGPAALYLKGKLRLAESFVSTGQPTFTAAAVGNRSKWLLGAYAGTTLDVHLNDRWSITGGADFLTAPTLKVSTASAAARFTFSHAIAANLGATYRF